MRFELGFVNCRNGELCMVTSALNADEVAVVKQARARGGDVADALALRRAYLEAPFAHVPMRPEVRWLDTTTH